MVGRVGTYCSSQTRRNEACESVGRAASCAVSRGGALGGDMAARFITGRALCRNRVPSIAYMLLAFMSNSDILRMALTQ